MRIVAAVAACAFAVGAVSGSGTGSGSAATELLPNLVPLPAAELVTQTAGGRTYLRFSTTSWNRGTGPLEIAGGSKEPRSARQKVYQRVYSSAGSYRDVLAGRFAYHVEHQHIHFEDYAVYTLQPVNAPGASARIGAKTTFCVMDTDHVAPTLAGSPASARYTSCDSSRQGMSVGWGDRYGRSLEGQALDITGLPDGEYDLKIEVDPKRQLLESDDGDNVSTLRLRLQGGQVR